MKRSEIENKLTDICQGTKGRIDSAPVIACIISFVLGAVVMSMPEFFLVIAILLLLVLGGLYFFSEVEGEPVVEPEKADEVKPEETPDEKPEEKAEEADKVKAKKKDTVS